VHRNGKQQIVVDDDATREVEPARSAIDFRRHHAPNELNTELAEAGQECVAR